MIYIDAFCSLCPFAFTAADRIEALEKRVAVLEVTFPARMNWHRKRRRSL